MRQIPREGLGSEIGVTEYFKDAGACRKCMEKHGLLFEPDTGTLPRDGPPAQPLVS